MSGISGLITLITLIFLLSGFEVGFAKEKFWVYFVGKNTLNQTPTNFLSSKSIERRNNQNITLDFSDFPLSEDYLQIIQNKGIKIERKSKWLNGVTCYLTNEQVNILNKLDFVRCVHPVGKIITAKSEALLPKSESNIAQNHYNYGRNQEFIELLKLNKVHELGFLGKDKIVAIFDDGFRNMHNIPAFKHLFDNNRILGTKDFVNMDDQVYDVGGHGTQVASVMAAILPNEFSGGSTEASYYLIRTENGGSETIQEEDNWVQAAEWADSAGVDVFQSSLVYNTFDNNIKDHTYKELDGKTAPMTLAADKAASKGILVVNSAGNEGAGSWKYICVPADGDSVLSVGATRKDKKLSTFSSIGPTSDGRIKPEVVTVGQEVPVIMPSGLVSTANGTSFSSPMIAAMCTSLWSSVPGATAWNVRKAVIQSGDRYANPDNYYGYGIPDATRAYGYLVTYTVSDKLKNEKTVSYKVLPNPAADFISIIANFGEELNTKSTLTFEIIGTDGKQIFSKKYHTEGKDFSTILWLSEITTALKGIYLIRLTSQRSGEPVWEGKLIVD